MSNLISHGEQQARLNDLRGVSNPFLSHGNVVLVDCLGNDQRIAEVAWTTTDINVEIPKEKDPENLIRYLMRHRHSTPFEFPVLDFFLRMPIDVARQHNRHRTAVINEFSTRYSEPKDECEVATEWRLQSTSTRQGSAGTIKTDWLMKDAGHALLEASKDEARAAAAGNVTVVDYLASRERELHEHAREVYEERIQFGVAKEQARKDLPMSLYTQMRWQINLKNLLHYLSLRMDSHAQLEIRLMANEIGKIVERLFPVVWAAFMDYHINSITLTALDIAVLKNISLYGKLPTDWERYCLPQTWANKPKNRERQECIAKLERLGYTFPPSLSTGN